MRKLSITVPSEDTKKVETVLLEAGYEFSVIEGKDNQSYYVCSSYG